MYYSQPPRLTPNCKPHDIAQLLISPKVPVSPSPWSSRSSSLKYPSKKTQVLKRSSVHADNACRISFLQERAHAATTDYELPFNSLIEHDAMNLPMQVDTTSSLYGVVGGESLSEGEILNLHFLKETDVVVGNSKFGSDQHKIMVPVCSSYQCNIGLCTDAQTDVSNIMKLLRSSPLPKVVCVKKEAWPVKAGEMLLIKGISDTINCWSITEQKIKCLSKSCEASFSVAPECTKVYLSDIIDHCQLPITVLLYTSAGTRPLTLTIKERLTMKSVIASKQNNPDELIEVEVSSCKMTVRRLEVSKHSLKQLQESTAFIYKAFHPSQVGKIMANTRACYGTYETKLFTSVLDDWKSSIRLIQPSSLPPEMIPALPRRGRSPSVLSAKQANSHQSDRKLASLSDEYVEGYISCAQQTPFLINLNSCYDINLHSDIDTACNEYTPVEPDFDHTIHPPTTIDQDCIFVLRERNGTSMNMECLPHDQEYDLIYESAEEAMINVTERQKRNNHNILCQYSADQVLDLLDALKLSQYKEVFNSEGIDGNLFMELNEEILCNELGVKSKLHQIKIRHIIDGKKPIPI